MGSSFSQKEKDKTIKSSLLKQGVNCTPTQKFCSTIYRTGYYTTQPIQKGRILAILGESSFHDLVTHFDLDYNIDLFHQDAFPNTQVMYAFNKENPGKHKKKIVLVAKQDLSENVMLTLDHRQLPWKLEALGLTSTSSSA